MDDPLWVFFGRRLVGRLTNSPLEFTYDSDWLRAEDAFPVSIALPLDARTFTDESVRGFFFNLLPEGGVRRQIAGRLGLSEGNEYEILSAIGGECAGALSILRSREASLEKARYDLLTDDDIAARIESGSAFGTVVGVRGVRLSLAGAQDKLPVLVDDRGVLLPKGSAASSHILKFENRDFKNLPANEVFVLRIAVAIGLPTVHAILRRVGKHNVAVIERYDRERRDDIVTRIHQEDFCQALGLPAERKYELEGGPSFARCVELVRAHSTDPLSDVNGLVRWQIFNACIGNSDGHSKNLSFLHGAAGTRLAPFYDLVCTRAYPRLDRRLAMRIGKDGDADRLSLDAWKRFAGEIGVGERFVLETVREVSNAVEERVEQALRSVEREFRRQEYLRSTVLPAIRAANRRVALSLRPPPEKR